MVDESHVTIPQIGAIRGGHVAQATPVVTYRPPLGHGQPSTEVGRVRTHRQTVYLSATPANTNWARPTGRPADHPPDKSAGPGDRGQADEGQIDDLPRRSGQDQPTRILVTILTKRMAEDLTDYLTEHGVKVHTCIPTSTPCAGSSCSASCAWASSTCWWHQPAARGPDLPEVSGGHPRRRQGGASCARALADPDHRPQPATCRARCTCMPTDHRFHGARHLRNEPPPRDPGGVQQGTRSGPVPLRKKIADITDQLPARTPTPGTAEQPTPRQGNSRPPPDPPGRSAVRRDGLAAVPAEDLVT